MRKKGRRIAYNCKKKATKKIKLQVPNYMRHSGGFSSEESLFLNIVEDKKM